MSISERIVGGLVWATSNAIKSELFGALCFGGAGAIGAISYYKIPSTIPVFGASAAYTGVLVGLVYSSVMQFDKFALGCAAAGALISSYNYGCRGEHDNSLFNRDNMEETDLNLVKALDSLGFGALLGTALYACAQAAASYARG